MKRVKWFAFLLIIFSAASCNVTENITDGQTAYDLKKYDLAASMLQKDFNKEERPAQKAKLAYQIADSYKFNNKISEAATWYKTAIDWDYGSDAILNYARMLQAQENYRDAIVQFKKYLEDEPYRRPEITLEINACDQALIWIERQKNEYERDTYVTNVELINSPAADFNPVNYKDNIILFTSSRASATGEKGDKWTGEKYYDIYQTTNSGFGKFSTPELFNSNINGDYNDGALAFSKDGTEMIFTRCGSGNKKEDDYCNLYYTISQPDGRWAEPQILPFFEDSLNIGTVCFAPDGQSIYFAAVHPDGYGGSDIYMSKRLYDGWDAPVNLGQSINTTGNEIFPYFSSDGTFYFASDGLPGMGGLDIFSAKLSKGKFTKIENLQYPINSGGDDFGILIEDMATHTNSDTLAVGYFSSSRSGGAGGDDIYMFVKTTKKLPPPVYILSGKVMQKVYEHADDVNSKILDTIPLPDAVATITKNGDSEMTAKFDIKNDGYFTTIILPDANYKIVAKHDGYFTNSIEKSSHGLSAQPGDTLQLYAEIVLDKIPSATTEIKLNNIYYDYDKATLRAESFPELDKLVKLLQENPALNIQLNANTDSRGKDAYNLKLSQGRAKSVVDYLVTKGIDENRLVSKGYGETNPVVLTAEITLPNNTKLPAGTILTESVINTYKSNTDVFEFLHQLNRRTSFNVLSATINIQSAQPDDVKTDKAPEH